MEENKQISFTKNLNKINFSSIISIPIDSNVHIKNILDVNAYVHDQKVECSNGKAIITGKISVKVLYLDIDNMTNLVCETQNFSETCLDNSITNNTYLNISNLTVTNTILSSDGILKINCEINLNPILYLNITIPNTINSNEKLITRKSEVATNYISSFVNTNFDFFSNIETRDNVSKILCFNSYFVPEKITPENGFATIEGNILTSILFENIVENEITLKEIKESTKLKYDVEIGGLSKEDNLDLSISIDKSNDEIKAEIEDGNNIITAKHKICVSGVILKTANIDIVDDIYSTDNEIECSYSKREFSKTMEKFSLTEVISNEFSLNSDEPAIDEVLANLNITPDITNTYVKNNNITLEGIICSNLTYIDENKELKHKEVESPFVIETKIPAESLGCVHNSISIIDSKVKVKRGTIIEMEYTIFINLAFYEKETHEVIDGFTIGKTLDFSKYDFQIFIGKPNETLWELCKRIKISPDEIHKYNKDLPSVLNGGEKIIIKR